MSRRSRLRKRRKAIKIIPLVLAVLLLGSVAAWAAYFPVEIVEVKGTELSDPDKVLEKLIPPEKRTMLALGLLMVKGKEVPGIAPWKLQRRSLSEYVLVIREEEPVAVIRSEGHYLGVGISGAVLSVDEERPEGIPLIIGCGISGGETLTMPEVQDREAYEGLLTYGRAVKNMGLPIVSLQYAEGCYFIHFTDIIVSLGDVLHVESKLRVVQDQMNYYEGLTGTLHLENFDPDSSFERYVFEVDTPDSN